MKLASSSIRLNYLIWLAAWRKPVKIPANQWRIRRSYQKNKRGGAK